MMYSVLAVVVLNYFLYRLTITFRENLDRGVFYFSRWTGGGFPPSPWAATSQRGVGDPELVRLFHPVLSHIFGGPELVRLFVANIWTTNQVWARCFRRFGVQSITVGQILPWCFLCTKFADPFLRKIPKEKERWPQHPRSCGSPNTIFFGHWKLRLNPKMLSL